MDGEGHAVTVAAGAANTLVASALLGGMAWQTARTRWNLRTNWPYFRPSCFFICWAETLGRVLSLAARFCISLARSLLRAVRFVSAVKFRLLPTQNPCHSEMEANPKLFPLGAFKMTMLGWAFFDTRFNTFHSL